MTSQKITELSSFFAGNAGVQAASKAKAGNASFSDLMKQGTEKPEGSSGFEKKETEQASLGSRGTERVKNPSNLDRSKESAAAGMDDRTSKALDQAKEIADRIADEIKETLGITDEELASAMETLGLTMMDLLNPESLQQVFTELSGVEDAVSLLTNEDLYSSLQQIMDTAEESLKNLQQELSLDDQEFDSLLTQIKQTAQNPSTDALAAGQSFLQAEPEKEEEEPVKVVVEDNSKAPDGQTVTAETETVPTQKTEKEEHREADGEQSRQEQYSGADFSREIMDRLTDAVSETDTTGYSTYADAEEITKQVIDQIKVRISEESTSMEMQLNPESLGRLNLTVEARNGVITAQITAQEEAVRNIIEGQVELLRQTLEDQGVKVEAVEVSVAAHEFEQNLQQGKDQTRQEEERAAAIGGRRRTSINLLGEEDEEEGELDEADRLNRDMMIRNGNTVDYTA